MAIKVFADGANLEGMLDMYENGNVQGFTTNPSLMKKGGVTDYRAFAKEVLAQAFGRRHQGQRHYYLYAYAGRRDDRCR